MVNHPNRKKAEVEVNHAEQNAAAWYGTIAELVAALAVDYDRLEELTEERADHDEEHGAGDWAISPDYKSDADELRELITAATIEGEIQKDADAVRERIQEGPLSVEVRSDWQTPGSFDTKPSEFCILLSTGGPALRLCGDLNEYGEPTRAYLQHQDWGTSWTDYFPGSGSGEVLLTYCQQFYFGE